MLTVAEWHHVVVTWESRDGAVNIYLNGSHVWSGVISGGKTVDGDGTLVLGQVRLMNLLEIFPCVSRETGQQS